MQVFLGLRRFPPGGVATVGNFDGVHLGHQRLIEILAERGKRLGLPVTVMTFEPQPLEYFLKNQAPARLTCLREKLARFKELPVDQVVLLRFTPSLAKLPAWEFIDKVLVKGVGVRSLVVGEDFRFGREREGDFALLQAASSSFRFEARAAPTIELEGTRISSTRIRQVLKQGELGLAEKMLGRPYSMCGRVMAGGKRGRELGFPTANLNLKRLKSPVSGVFAVTVKGVADEPWPGVANVGTRPTVEKGGKVLLEVHLFDFAGDLYGRQLEVFFHHKLRDELKFSSILALRAQIQKDAALARKLLRA